MTQPTRYEPRYNFNVLPVPGDRINAELFALKDTIDEICDNLAVIQRDDHEPANLSVGWDQLKAELRTGVNPATEWESLKTYSIGDAVFNGTSLYRCVESHKAGLFATDLSAGKWVLMADFSADALLIQQHVDSRIADTPTSIAGVSTDTVLSPAGGREQRDYWSLHSPLFPRTNGFYSNDIYGDTDAPGATANIIRAADRFFVGAAADIKSTKLGYDGDGASYIASGLGLLYLDRAATFGAYANNGGVGGVFASTLSRKNTNSVYGSLTLWATGQSVTAGNRRVYLGRLYEATTTGTTGATPPTHTTGTASDDAVTWQFVDHLYMTTIALSSVLSVDADNSGNGWGFYQDITRSSGAVAFGQELALKNKGADVTLNPYSGFGGIVGIWLAAGGDAATGGAPTAPSTLAIDIGPNASTFNTGIRFKDGFGTDLGGGEMQAVVMPRQARIDWYYSGGNRGISMLSAVNQSASQQRLIFGNSNTALNNASNIPIFEVEIVSGTVTGNIRLSASTSALPTVSAQGSATDIDLRLLPKGTGLLRTAIGNVPNYADDSAAQAGGVPVGGFYRNGSVVMIRAA